MDDEQPCRKDHEDCPVCQDMIAEAVEVELERCCAVRCDDCRDGVPAYEGEDGFWTHSSYGDDASECEAADLRARAQEVPDGR